MFFFMKLSYEQERLSLLPGKKIASILSLPLRQHRHGRPDQIGILDL